MCALAYDYSTTVLYVVLYSIIRLFYSGQEFDLVVPILNAIFEDNSNFFLNATLLCVCVCCLIILFLCQQIIFTNVGNPHALGQKPLTFPRQVDHNCHIF